MLNTEEQRIIQAYGRRHGDSLVYSLFNPGQLFIVQQLEEELIRSLRRHQVSSLSKKKILDVGCGTASPLRRLISYGAEPENLYGIDLLEDALEEAKRINPNMHFRLGNAENLPYEDQSFDMVTQFTIFTSILNDTVKCNIALEMLRVLRAQGIIVWYDYFVSKPTNIDVKGIGKREIMRLFPNCTYDFGRATLAPPIARVLAPYSFLLCYLLDKIPWLRTHYLVVIRKRS